MEGFWEGVEQWWNDSGLLAWILILLGMATALWASLCPQSAGVSIGILALAAGIMSVRPKMHPAEKFGWVALLVTFAVLEVVAIGRSDRANETAREKLNKEFETIADGLKNSIGTSKTQYENTVKHVDGVLKTTQAVQSLSRQNLENMTGGNSYGYVDRPRIFPEYKQNDGFSLDVINAGNEILTGVTVTISHVKQGGMEDEKLVTDGYMNDKGNSMNPIFLGNLTAHGARNIPGFFIQPQSFTNGEGHFIIEIFAQNGESKEETWYRKAKNGHGWAVKYDVYREVKGRLPLVKRVDWTEPLYPR